MDLRCKYSPSLGIAITGSTGFIGSSLIKTFGSNDFESATPEQMPPNAVVIHLAADVGNTSEAMLENIANDTRLLDVINTRHRGIVYASTNNIYPYALDCRLDEQTRCNDYYAASKIFGEKLLTDLSKVPAVSVRIADVFGVGQKHGNLFRAVEQSVRAKTALSLYGLGLKRRTYIHVQELCEQLKFVALNWMVDPHTRPKLNLGYADSASVNEIIETASRTTGLPIKHIPLTTDNSGLDIRTMQPTFLSGYVPRWSSFREAFVEHLDQIVSKQIHEI